MNNFFQSNRIAILALFYLLCLHNAGYAGQRVNSLNHFGVGARAIGLNSAYTAISNDYTAPFWNPAAMDFFSTIKLGGMHKTMSLNREINYFSFVLPTHQFGAVAIAWANLGISAIEARTSNTEQPDSHFNYNENTFFFAYAYRVVPYLSVGSNFKLYNFRTFNMDATGFGVDLALLFIPSNKIRVGLVAQDMESQLKWSSTTTEKFLPTYRLGLSFDPLSNISISCDYHQTQHNRARFSVATELLTLNLLKLRCGIAEQRFTCGVGFTLFVKPVYLNFNYAMATDRFNQGVSDVFDVSVVF